MTKAPIIAVIGLGYVGLPVAVAFGRKGFDVVGFDIDPQRLRELCQGLDRTNECSREELAMGRLNLTGDAVQLRRCTFFILTVPTPIDKANRPDLTSLLKASETVG